MSATLLLCGACAVLWQINSACVAGARTPAKPACVKGMVLAQWCHGAARCGIVGPFVCHLAREVLNCVLPVPAYRAAQGRIQRSQHSSMTTVKGERRPVKRVLRGGGRFLGRA